MPPERLLKALLLMALYPIRGERPSCARVGADRPAFSRNRDRWEEHRLTQGVFDAVAGRAVTHGLCREHSSVDGTLIEGFAAAKSFRPKGEPDDRGDGNAFQPRNPEVDFRGQERSNDTPARRTDPEARLYRKGAGQEARLSPTGHLRAENRHGRVVGVAVSEANGTAERQAALDLLTRAKRRHLLRPTTLGAGQGYDAGELFRKLERREVTPHVPIVKPPRDPKAVPREDQIPEVRARRRMQARLGSEGDTLRQRCRKKIEEGIGWLRTVAGLARGRWVGRWELR